MSPQATTRLAQLPVDEQFRALLREAGQKVLEHYDQVEQGVVIKSDNSPQTVADRDSHHLRCKFLEENSPFPVYSEEAIPASGFKADVFWTLDPLDGTQDFIQKTDEFSIMASLVENRRPVFGIVYQPVTGRLYAAEKGKGTFLIDANGHATRLHVSGPVPLQETRVVFSRCHPQKTDQEIAAALRTTRTVPHGSFGLKIGLIARGDADLMTYPPKVTSIWDSSPNIVMLTEAGGKITDLDGKELLVDPASPRNMRGIIATSGHKHEQLLETVRTVLS